MALLQLMLLNRMSTPVLLVPRSMVEFGAGSGDRARYIEDDVREGERRAVFAQRAAKVWTADRAGEFTAPEVF